MKNKIFAESNLRDEIEAMEAKTRQRRLQRNETCINFYWKSILNNIEKAEMEKHRKFFFMYCYYGRTSIHTIYLSSEWAMALHHKNSTWTRNARLMPVVSFSFVFLFSFFFFFLFLLSSNSHFRQLHTYLFYILFK